MLFRLSDFSQPVSFDHAEIGHCPNLALPPPPAPLPDEEEPDKEEEKLKPSQASTPAAVWPPDVSFTVDIVGREELELAGMTCLLFKNVKNLLDVLPKKRCSTM